jgi:hypothetical protein
MNSQEFRDFESNNPWFKAEPMKAAAAVAAMAELNKQLAAEGRSLTLAQKFAHVEASVKKAFGMETRRSAGPAVESSRGGADSGGGDGTGRSYNDLPADAKQACDDLAERFVGKGKFKTLADWRKSYTKKYFE